MSRKVLAVDDSRTIRNMLNYALSQAGFTVETACDGEDGLEKLRLSRPDVIITDINMPRLDGFGFIERVRYDGQNRTLPILVLTTESASSLKDRARSAGATGWIVKPFSEPILVSAINRVVA